MSKEVFKCDCPCETCKKCNGHHLGKVRLESEGSNNEKELTLGEKLIR